LPRNIVMSGLDEERVRQFAAGQNLQSLEAFMGQIEAANLWQFARRPLDLDWLVQFWHSHGRLGPLAEMLEICISERLQESNHDRARQDNLDLVRATQAVERIGAALVFDRRETITVPDSELISHRKHLRMTSPTSCTTGRLTTASRCSRAQFLTLRRSGVPAFTMTTRVSSAATSRHAG
jgi:hypothetical protein